MPGTTNVTFTWNPVSDPSGIEAYNYQISTRSDFPEQWIAYQGSVAGTSVNPGPVGMVTWYWRIQAAGRAGNLSAWSDPFVVHLGNATPPSTAPSLLSPGNGAAVSQPVNFDWSDVAGATSYEIQIDNSSSMSAPLVVSQNVTSSQVSIGGLPAQQLWWRVRAINSGGNGPFSTVRSFTVQSGGPPPGRLPAPSLISPASDARFSPGRTINFDWSDVSGAASYQLQIDNSESFSAPLTLSQSLTVSQFATNSLPTQRMWWRVRAVSSSGSTGAWSSVRRFEVKQ
jgi:predicted phage tail protein